MEIKETIVIPTEVITDIVCDSCGKSCLIKIPSSDFFNRKEFNHEYNAKNVSEFLTIKGDWGYFSKKDGERWEAHICEKCVDEKLSFIKFNKTDYTR